MNVLSLCDGMSCAQIALDKLGVEVDNYFASEINEYSIKVTQDNYPDTVQLGDMTELDGDDLRELPKIDLVIAGSPCRNLSRTVVNRENYNQGLEGEHSSLFYDFARILNWIQVNNNTDVSFVLENVESMSDEDEEIITETLGVESVMINSKLFSAQDRKRYYWTDINIDLDKLPEFNDEFLSDIMLSVEEVNKLHNNSRMNFWYDEGFEFHSWNKRVVATLDINGHDILKRVYNPQSKAPTLTACRGGNTQKKVFQDAKCRKLTPVEYERLQTVPDGYTSCVSNTRRYNMLGDGFTVDVIKFILGSKEW